MTLQSVSRVVCHSVIMNDNSRIKVLFLKRAWFVRPDDDINTGETIILSATLFEKSIARVLPAGHF